MGLDEILDVTADVFYLFICNVELGLTFSFFVDGDTKCIPGNNHVLAGCGEVIYFLDSAWRSKPYLTLNTTRIQKVP